MTPYEIAEMRVMNKQLVAEREALKSEVEQLRVQLAGCGVAAMQNTESSKDDRAKRGDYGWSESYGDVCRAVDREIELRAKLAELEAHTKTLTQAAYAARLERDVAWQRCKELEAQEPKDGNSIHTLEQEPVAWGQPDAERNIVDTVTADDKAQAHDGWAYQYTVPLYKRGTP